MAGSIKKNEGVKKSTKKKEAKIQARVKRIDIESPEDLLEFLKDIKGEIEGVGECGHDHSDRKIEKTIKVRPEWKPLFEDLKNAKIAANRANEKAKTMHRRAWSQVESDLNLFDRSMHYNHETQTIDIEE